MRFSVYLCTCLRVMNQERLGSDIRTRNQRRSRCPLAWASRPLVPGMAAADFASSLRRIWKALILCGPGALALRLRAVLPLAEQVDGMKARPN